MFRYCNRRKLLSTRSCNDFGTTSGACVAEGRKRPVELPSSKMAATSSISQTHPWTGAMCTMRKSFWPSASRAVSGKPFRWPVVG